MAKNEQMVQLREGDVVSYNPPIYHCHEGTAVVTLSSFGNRILRDTYWTSDRTVVEPDLYELVFNLTDYERVTREKWERFAPEDQQMLTHQHGLQRDYYIRAGATESPDQIIANAREELRVAEERVRSAQSSLEGARRVLDYLLRQR